VANKAKARNIERLVGKDAPSYSIGQLGINSSISRINRFVSLRESMTFW
jgi:hypothetical protein